ncbi:MAG: NADH:ubiquinone oxidoreductase [Gemmatimonadetes bacterium]|nr:NADH:ubiquinone oxidoreductase [Gemmatimonadota bacterium]
MTKPKVGFFGVTGCAGDLLNVLNCEDQLLDLVDLVDIREFLMASSEGDHEVMLDVAFIEGCVVSQRDEDVVKAVRQRTRLLVALGTCAMWGGVPTLDRLHDRGALLQQVYGDFGRTIDTRPAQALDEIVKVDFGLPGCPIEKHEFLAAVANLLNGNLPQLPHYPVCAECRFAENRCLLGQDGALCLGPLTIAGCDARCPSLGVACNGCRGPAPDANFESAATLYQSMGYTRAQVERAMATFAPLPGAVH